MEQQWNGTGVEWGMVKVDNMQHILNGQLVMQLGATFM